MCIYIIVFLLWIIQESALASGGGVRKGQKNRRAILGTLGKGSLIGLSFIGVYGNSENPDSFGSVEYVNELECK